MADNVEKRKPIKKILLVIGLVVLLAAALAVVFSIANSKFLSGNDKPAALSEEDSGINTPESEASEINPISATPTEEKQAVAPTLEAKTAEATQTISLQEVIWGEGDSFDSRNTEYPFGDQEAWTYIQTWDGSDISTVLHVAWGPGIKVVVREYVGTRYQVWNGPDLERWNEMAVEVKMRDELPQKPPLIIIYQFDQDVSLPPTWDLEALQLDEFSQ